MKILWIVNTILDKLSQHLYGRPGDGLWMDALITSFADRNDYQIVVATVIKTESRVCIKDRNITYYALPDNFPTVYDENDKNNIKEWKRLLDEEKPDLIQVWGTEFTHGLCALRLAKTIPAVVFIQGYLGSIARFYLAGMEHLELIKSVTIRDILKRDSIIQQQKKYFQKTKKEKEMLSLAGNIIFENDWCKRSIESIIPQIASYQCPISINDVFYKKRWSIEKVEPHSIICTASGYPLKGLHMVLKALALLKRDFPDVKLYIPGDKMISDGTIQWMLRKKGYKRYIEKLISQLGIEDNIIWMGRVSQAVLAEQYSKTNVFVLSSSIENHSSSLIEAMIVGTPSIATNVGGVPEYVIHGKNGYLYRFEEYEIMAGYVKELFNDEQLARKISQNAVSTVGRIHNNTEVFDRMIAIYTDVLKG